MSEQTRPKPTRMMICDLCDQEIPEGEPSEAGSLTYGYIAHKVEMPRTKHAWLRWPPSERHRKARVVGRAGGDEFRHRHYDFHAECVLRLVESAMTAPTDASDEAAR